MTFAYGVYCEPCGQPMETKDVKDPRYKFYEENFRNLGMRSQLWECPKCKKMVMVIEEKPDG